METIKCPKCGAEIAPNAKFCEYCGAVISPQSPPPYTEHQTPPQSSYANPQQPPYSNQQQNTNPPQPPYAGQQPYTGPQGPYANGNWQQGYSGYQQKSKLAAGLLGIFFGGLGIHNFYLGYTNKALIQLLVSILGGVVTLGIASFAMWIWGFVEGILILTGSINVDARGIPLGE